MYNVENRSGYNVENRSGRFLQLPALVKMSTVLQKYWDEAQLADGMFCYLIEEQSNNPYRCTYAIVWGGNWLYRDQANLQSLDYSLLSLLEAEIMKYDGYVTPYKDGGITIGEHVGAPTLQVNAK